MYKNINIFNPNPITKIIVTILLSFTIMYSFTNFVYFSIVIIISILFILNNFIITGISSFIFYLFLYSLPNFEYILKNLPFILQIFVGLFITIKMFFLPFYAGKLFIKTSDVSSIIFSMNKLKVPNFLSIPIAVMFRFFPSFKEERNNIKLAMKIRGISIRKPLLYFETIVIPILFLSSNIADDISKAAETKCIETKIKKHPYFEVKFKLIDLIYFLSVFIILLGGIYVNN